MDWLMALAPPLGAGYLKLVGLTARYRVKGWEHYDAIKKGHGRGVWVVWHNRLIGGIILQRDKNVGALISKSRDGELISRAVERLGYAPLRGSTSRNSSGVAKAAIRHLREGYDVVFTPDGPRGPRYEVQAGAAWAAKLSGAPVLPIGVGATPKAVFKSWDRFQLPLPFSRIQVVLGEPLTFSEADDIAYVQKKIKDALDRVTAEADGILGVVSP